MHRPGLLLLAPVLLLLPAAAGRALASSGPDTLRLLAVMVEFAPDNDARTTGDGTFDLSSPSRRIKDPPPHDARYFGIHLSFLANYYRKVSGGALEIAWDLLPDVYRLPSQMRTYSPPRNSADNAELAFLVRDTWRFADSASPGIPFDRYDAFVIFHAGAGRDIDLVSLYGFDPTPFDIPSLTLDLAALRNVFGQSFDGVPVAGGAFRITNSMIIPETESRTIPVVGGSALLQLGINGLLASSVGSRLGLPDLFDTKTGRTAIGRFGLMDGQSIFSWNGFIPPEPSAWEKIALGWPAVVEAPSGASTVELPAVGAPGARDTIVRVPVSAREYFLLENRNRDPGRNGQTVTMVWGPDTVVRTWTRDTSGFSFANQDSVFGVLLDVEDFDWSLPGGVNSRTGEWFDGGILIWHVDETVIEANRATGTVNADPDRRGVDLEEADGSQDIGQSYGFISAGAGSEDGTVFDYWYDGNQAPLRIASNVFGPVSHPASRGNNGTNSHVSVSGFSARGARMTAVVAVGDSVVSPVPGYPRRTDAVFDAAGPSSAHPGWLIAVGAGSPPAVYGWTTTGEIFLPAPDTTGRLSFEGGVEDYDSLFPRAAVGYLDGDFFQDIVLAGNEGGAGRLYAAELFDADDDLRADSLFEIALPRPPTTAPVIADSFVAVGTARGFVYLVNHDGTGLQEHHVFSHDSSDVLSLALLAGGNGIVATSSGGRIGTVLAPVCAGASGARIAEPAAGRGLPVRAAAARFHGAPGAEPNLFTYVTASEDGWVSIDDVCTGALPGFPYRTGGPVRAAPAIADVDRDGLMDIAVFAGRRVLVLNQAGAPLDGFPVEIPSASDLSGSPVVADLDGDGSYDIAGVTSEGVVFALDRGGRMLAGFPLQAGPNRGTTPAVFHYRSGCLSCAEIGIAVAAGDGRLYAWRTGGIVTGPAPPPVQPWPQYARDERNSALEDTVLTRAAPGAGFLPASRTYNWPNPVGPDDAYRTHIRYYVPVDAAVTIRIFDLAGILVRSFEGLQARGGVDNEVEWDVSEVQSGVYFARIEAAGASGSGSAVITIAVVK